jgi:ferrous iron transport protein A
MTKKTLSTFLPGTTGLIVGFCPMINKTYRKRLLAMGITRGIEFEIIRYAPMGDPIEIKIRGYTISLRKDDAALILAI